MTILSSIKKTINYSKKYKARLTKEQLFERLISNQIYTKEKFNKNLNPKLLKTFFLSEEEKLVEEKVRKAENLANLIKNKFKNILFLGITGSVAAGYPKKNDDIDIIIITKKDKLWVTRIQLRLFVLINKIPHRKLGRKEKNDDFCFNLWLDEKNLTIQIGRASCRERV